MADDNSMNEAITVDELFRENVDRVIPVSLDEEMKTSFIDYAMSVITDRALPDVRDGLKPVHRRILYSMYTQGFTPDKPYRKCATTVGDVIGRFHPHGDAAVYDALVRLAQSWSMRHRLVDGHGNFGSRDGDSAAAYRYTEARLPRISLDLLRDINKDTVDFKPNFDDYVMEPVVLPSRFPNLLVNGQMGIAVGMATNIPPHNLGEAIDAAICLMENPEADLDELMEHLKAPDFPTGATIMGLEGVREMYATGRGRITVQATIETEEMSQDRYRLVVTDLPYQVNKATEIVRMSDLVKEKRIEGVSNIRDESDRNSPIRIVIELKRDANPKVVMNQLYRYTRLQDSFSANLLALVPDEVTDSLLPRTLTLHDALYYYIEHQKEVVIRRTKYDLERAEARKHIVEGLLLAIDNIDEVIQIIRSSHTETEAKERLSKRFGLSERQAQHIVDMRLGRLTGLEREKLEEELAEIIERIAGYRRILDEPAHLIEVLKEELLDVKGRFADERRTAISPFSPDGITDESLIPEEDVIISLTGSGYVKRVPTDTYTQQHRGGRGVIGMGMKDEDYVHLMINTSTHDLLYVFTDTARVFRMKGYEIPEAGRHARGVAFVNLLQLQAEEKIVGIVPVPTRDEDEAAEFSLIQTTAKGQVKKTKLTAFKNIHRSGIIAASLREGDRLVAASFTRGDDDLIIITKKGMAIRFHESDVRSMGRSAMGVRGIRLRDGDEVIWMGRVVEEDDLFVVTENGYGKRVLFSEFNAQTRGGKGLIVSRLTKRTGGVAAAGSIQVDEDLMLVNSEGVVIRMHADEISLLGRYAQGVRLMRSDEGVTVVDSAVVPREEESEDLVKPEDFADEDDDDELDESLEELEDFEDSFEDLPDDADLDDEDDVDEEDLYGEDFNEDIDAENSEDFDA